MSFNLKSVLKSQSVQTAGAFVVALGVFHLIQRTFEHMIGPLFNVINDTGTVRLASNIYLGCGGFLTAALVAAAAVFVGVSMARMSGKD